MLAPQLVVAGAPVNLAVVAHEAGPVVYQWFTDGAALIGATNASYAVMAATAADAGAYTVAVTGANGTLTSTPASSTFPSSPPGGTGDQTLITGFTMSSGSTASRIVPSRRSSAAFFSSRNSTITRRGRKRNTLPQTTSTPPLPDRLREQFGNDRSKLLAYLQTRGVTMSDFRREVEDDIIYSYMRSQERKLDPNLNASRAKSGRAEAQVHLRMIQLTRSADATDAAPLDKANVILRAFQEWGSVRGFSRGV